VAEANLESDREHEGSLFVDPAAPFGWRYGSTSRLGADDFVNPLAARQARVAGADLLP
jgi:hypothetical protein